MSQSFFSFSRKAVAHVLLGGFFVVTVVTPAAPVNKLLFVALTLWLVADLLFAPSKKIGLTAPPVAIFSIFLYGFCLSQLNHANSGLAVQLLLSVLILFQISFIRNYQIDVERLIRVASNAMVLATVLLWCATFIPEMPMASLILDFMRTYSLSAFSEREFFEDATISLHLGTAPILLIGFSIIAKSYAKNRKLADLLMAVATAMAILLSASRGVIAGSGIVLVVIILLYSPRKLRLALVTMLGVFLVYVVHGLLFSSSLFSADEASNAGKIGHIKSFFEQLTLPSLIFGRGLANWYYSSGADAMKAETEVSPMDMVRYFGVLLTILLYYFIVFPVRRRANYLGESFIDFVIFMVYLLLSFTNPIMFNSMGMIVILWYWSRIYSSRGKSMPPVNERLAKS